MTPDDITAPADGFIARVSARMAEAPVEPAPEPIKAPAAPEPATSPEPASAAEPEIPEVPDEAEEVEVDDFGLPIDKPVEPDPADDKPEEGEDDLDPKARHAWKTVRTELKSEKAARQAAEAKLAEIEARLNEREASTPDLTELQAKVAEYEKVLAVTKLEASPAYQEAVEKPFQAVITRLDEIAAQYEIDNIALSKAVAIPDKKERAAALKDLLVGVDDDDRLEVRELARNVEKIVEKQAELVTNADKALAELEAEAEKKQAAEIAARAEERKQTVAKVIPHIAKKVPSFAAQIEALAGKIADTDLAARPVTRQVFDAAAGELLPTVLADRAKLLKDLQDALEENEKLRRSTPGSGAGGGGGGSRGGSGDGLGETFSERVAKRLGTAA